jgi:hypothetical protein
MSFTERMQAYEEALNSQDREAFERLMEAARNNCMAASDACRPIIFEAMVVSIMLFRRKRLDKLEKEFRSVKERKT